MNDLTFHNKRVTAISTQDNGKDNFIVISISHDGIINLSNLTKAKIITSLKPNEGKLNCLQHDLKYNRIFICSENGKMIIYNITVNLVMIHSMLKILLYYTKYTVLKIQ
jgi:WD40 repeat protein